MNCPVCEVPLETTARSTPAGLHCLRCGHLWRVRNGQPVAINAGNPLLTSNPAPTVTYAPAEPAVELGVMTAAKAAPFIEQEIG